MQSTVWPGMRLSAVSKSNMGCGSSELSIPIGGIEKPTHVLLHRVLQRGEIRVIARAAQIFDAGLREVLVLVPDRSGHTDVLDVRRTAERCKHCGDQRTERSRTSSTHVVYSGYRRTVHEPGCHRNRIIHVNEIA